jgi:hypothetical protein
MRLPKRVSSIFVLSVALAVSSLSALPASATVPSSATLPAAGSILCEGDLCIQTNSVSDGTAVTAAWARSSSFYGHFELDTGEQVLNSPQQTWSAGGQGYKFTFNLNPGNEYNIIAWKCCYSSIGSVVFGVN